jgi:hypothetical protein
VTSSKSPMSGTFISMADIFLSPAGSALRCEIKRGQSTISL